MGTSQSKFSNVDGSTTFFHLPSGDPLYDFTGREPSRRDGTHGLRLFAESRGYAVETNFTQLILGQGDPGDGFTFNNYMAEIDAGRPVLIHLYGHTMLGYGYNADNNTIYIHDTWDFLNHSMTWGGTYSGMQHYAVTVLRMEDAVLQVVTADATNPTATSGRLNGNLTSKGTAASVKVSFQWGTSPGLYAKETTPELRTTLGAFFFDIEDLEPGLPYTTAPRLWVTVPVMVLRGVSSPICRPRHPYQI